MGQSIDYVHDVFGTERCWGVLDKKQCHDCSESHPRHRLSLTTRGLVVNLWPGQIMNAFVALQRKKKQLSLLKVATEGNLLCSR